ncbi:MULTISPECIES: DUF3526 domain-containing protein [Myroides]|uniref:DUF3526 domain-containing protein n=1 Tax=Myroides TaxID=76831 RepID=UPI00132A737B|nr:MULTISPECIES: DUF3526 domain-containing protein [Myroides]MDM1444449.1 DUF3526 domain-containing protein [Myroides odoratimimus]MVX36589.1 DUF3526 domain-containing protein [Myroides sp. LoEW2-1]
MNKYLYKQFFQNKVYVFSLILLFFLGILSIHTGVTFLEKNNQLIQDATEYQEQSIQKNTAHETHIGSTLYYIKFHLFNEPSKLTALNIGMRDFTPSVKGITIRNLEEQKYNTDFYNPTSALAGNFDFSFVLIFLFPLIIIAITFNILSQEKESGTLKLLSLQSGDIKKIIDTKLIIRFLSISSLYFLLLLIAKFWIQIPLDKAFSLLILLGFLYIIFWFALCRFIVANNKSTSYNALALILIWIAMNFIVPMVSFVLIQKMYPIKEALQTVIEQRDGYHNKWDEPQKNTIDKFHNIYPQFKTNDTIFNNDFNWKWYYAMQHLADVESMKSSIAYQGKIKARNNAAKLIGYFFPSIHTLTLSSELALSDQNNILTYENRLEDFHHQKRLHFYPLIFSNQDSTVENWNNHKLEKFKAQSNVSIIELLFPLLLIIIILLIISHKKLKELC